MIDTGATASGRLNGLPFNQALDILEGNYGPRSLSAFVEGCGLTRANGTRWKRDGFICYRCSLILKMMVRLHHDDYPPEMISLRDKRVRFIRKREEARERAHKAALARHKAATSAAD